MALKTIHNVMNNINRHTKLLLFILFSFVGTIVFGQSNYKYIIAKEGDGIYRILERNHLDPIKYKKKFIALNEKKMGKNEQVYAGVKYKLPLVETTKSSKPTLVKSTAKSRPPLAIKKYKIFGSKYDTVHIRNNQLKGCVFYLVSGHGGPDPGAIETIENKMITEDEYAYDVTLRLGRELIRNGARVYIITRDPKDGIRDDKFLKNNSNELCYPNKKIPLNQRKRLRQRANAVNTLYKKNKNYKYQRLLVLHVDAHLITTRIDLFFYYFKRSRTGKNMAYNMREIIRQKYDQYQPHRGYNGKVVSRDLHMLSMTDPPTVFIELGNIKNSRDQKRLLQPGNRQLLAEWMVEGVIYDYKKQKK
ncbi:N-acetylmuramoyl-L-alanine amidase [Halosquirtibacter xylanolyticus]|uniref:N-acetylmuramoyl-L-alanine amidase family protein n=1 Tax=Halosquirtibacter xylanolyticus TaxID=3374599 RepID=UPI003748F19E|nr:N-acetylmuramoyl-L-alanine amidase [Prolixibacteraceae bacterium]